MTISTEAKRCDECGEEVFGPRERMFVEGKVLKVGECCFWALMGE